MLSPYVAEITISSAKDLKNVNWRYGKLQPFVVFWIDPKYKRSTPVAVDDAGDTSHHWNEKQTIPFNSPIQESTIYIDVIHANAADGIKPLIGSAKLHLREVVDKVGLGSSAERNLDLKRPSGRPHGKLEILIRVRETPYLPPDENYVLPYGVPPRGIRDYGTAPYGFPQYGTASPFYAGPPSGYPVYGSAPPQPAYTIYGGAPAIPYGQHNYAQPAYGQGNCYGQRPYGQYEEEEKKKSNFGGMGTGLAVGAVAGVLGGLAISEGVDALEDRIADDVAERVENDEDDDTDDF